ncbi:hypothetical protein OCH239_12615 [Roseivivax halodurans JCM 10272]|uniref:Uncharacterized protein n=1 Tax=Roseivivax halodurans JCM 10272 TaxID=1449350 RepID=X7EBN6_9RHOB|nr:hypothetical protein OCH239_12615 [Roseivivax halodurans JCM 10272]
MIAETAADHTWLKQVLFHFDTTPEVTSRAEYEHYIGQLFQMRARVDGDGDMGAIAMAYALMLRLQDYEATAPKYEDVAGREPAW